MIVEKVLGNLHELPADQRADIHVERVALEGAALRQRVQRVTTDHGKEFGLRLSDRRELRDGDILVRDGRNVVVVSTLPTEVLAIAPATVQEAAFVAHSLGNRHLPAQFFGPDTSIAGLEPHNGVMVIQYDHTAEHFLTDHGVRFMRVDRVMEVPFRHAEHTH
ncbi:urease accessory protein UreE [Kocuria sp. JC486]|uniref:Urease accessory protein UreE n=1 Tax=Kocuria soli TaxID=2485125 RepID=A0A3N3ZM59_9MICC|nr:urease accessory protein UreE [Kocuria soli]NHU86087.1 urease accessory protein UreE [Kocuria sp. JC486]ROZ61741.1 urease accessory protein UreE [Kocuria soli]